MSADAACATGTDDANAPARQRPTRMPEESPEHAITTLEKAAPARQIRSTLRLPRFADCLTMRGQQTICATEKHDVASPVSHGDAPNDCICSGNDEMATPSPSIWQKTPSQIGASARGSGSSGGPP